jgi:uncharacterized coiled-coil protein SlyX
LNAVTIWKRVILAVVLWLVAFAMVRWLVGGSLWLDLLLAGLVSGATYVNQTIAEHRRLIAEQRQHFDIADAQLVNVSATVDRLEEEVSDLKDRLEKVEESLSLLEDHDHRPPVRPMVP